MSLCVTLGEFHFRQKSNESDENLWRVPRWENSYDFLKQTAQPLVSSVGSSLNISQNASLDPTVVFKVAQIDF